ncbi:MAG: hypothetical protein ACD_72C00533G0001 [uncultured bacterium]|nr:MAG: hypothetical protein ACD_72C00533G0001 [uncultured bacterium]
MKKITIEVLKAQLQNNGIDLSKWGQGDAKTIEQLFEEIEEGETELIKDIDGKLVRKVLGVGADIYYVDGDKTFRLKEEKQVFGDGRVRVRDFGRAVSEKMKFGEYSHDAMVRGIQEELGISSNVTLHEIETIVDKKDSPSYPGLMSNYVVDVFKVELTSRQYKSEGYIEERDGLTTYFVWEQI